MKVTRKLHVTLGTLLLAISTSLYAKEHRTKEKKSCIFQEIKPDLMITINAGPAVKDGANAFVTADFIWWTARQDGIAYAATGWSGSPSLTGITLDCCEGCSKHTGEILRPDIDYDPGFKVGLGYKFGQDGWDVYGQFTWYRNRDNDSKSGSCQNDNVCDNVRPLWNIAGVFNEPETFRFFVNWPDGWFQQGPILNVAGDWEIDFYNIDLEIGRNFKISKCLSIRPHIGLKGTWQEQKYKAVYFTQDVEGSPTAAFRFTMDNKMDQWGIGARGGFNNSWYLIKDLSIFGNMALTALWSDFDVTRKDCIDQFETCEVVDCPKACCCNIHAKNEFDSHLRAVLEMTLGLRWETWMRDDRYHFAIEGGWEEQIWTNMNQFVRLRGERYNGDLTFHGLTIKWRLDF